MPLGENIKKYRELRGLTVQELADKMGIGRAGIYKWEANETKPGIESLTELSQALDVTADDLLRENHTGDNKPGDNSEKSIGELAVYRSIFEGKTEYIVLPRKVLDGTQLMSDTQIDENKKERENDQKIIDRLLDQNEKLMERVLSMESQLARVQKGKQGA